MSDDVRAAAEGFVDRVSRAQAAGYTLWLEEVEGLLLSQAYIAEHTTRPLDDWHEDIAPFALWWKFPVAEPPYCGSPLCTDWPGYHTHWTPIPMPFAPPPGNTGACPHE